MVVVAWSVSRSSRRAHLAQASTLTRTRSCAQQWLTEHTQAGACLLLPCHDLWRMYYVLGLPSFH